MLSSRLYKKHDLQGAGFIKRPPLLLSILPSIHLVQRAYRRKADAAGAATSQACV